MRLERRSQLNGLLDWYPTNCLTLEASRNLTAPPPAPPTEPETTDQFVSPGLAEFPQI